MALFDVAQEVQSWQATFDLPFSMTPEGREGRYETTASYVRSRHSVRRWRVGRRECCIGGDKMYPRVIHVDACGSAKVHEWKHRTLSGWDNDVHQHVRLGPRQPERSLLIQRHDLPGDGDSTKNICLSPRTRRASPSM